jgi:hypothetical protein
VQRAKAEVERVSRAAGGASVPPISSTTATAKRPTTSQNVPPHASIAERKKQVAQLADMGIAVPDEFRREMAMAGDWKVVHERPIQEFTFDEPLSVGVRKRKHPGEEEEEAGETVGRKGWGSTTKLYPGSHSGKDSNLDALLSGVSTVKKDEMSSDATQETEPALDLEEQGNDPNRGGPLPTGSALSLFIKEEISDSPLLEHLPAAEATGPEVVFKKRKAKISRVR